MSSVASQVNIERALSIGGWMSEQELLWLAIQARERKYIVEFGSLHGRSTRALADNNVDGKIWAVDPWDGKYYNEEGLNITTGESAPNFTFTTYVYPYFCENLKDHISLGTVIPIRGFSYNFKLDKKVDMVFIDGDHRYNTVVRDIKKAYELLKDGGLICGHDYGHPMWPGVKQAVDELIENVKIEGTIWFTIK